MQLLLDSKAEIDGKDDGGCTALMNAIRNREVKCAQLLLDAKADLEA